MNIENVKNEQILGVLLISTLLLLIVLLTLVVVLFIKVNKMKKNYRKLMTNANGENVESAIIGCVEKIDNLKNESNEHTKKINRLYQEIKLCTQKVAVIRYNAFDNVGSDQSFSIAFLDQNNDGVVVSGIYNRTGSSTYAKPIQNSASKYALSVEEVQAIEVAKKNFGQN